MNETKLDPSRTVFTSAINKTRSLGFKAFLIAVLLLIFLIPLNFVKSIVRDRQAFKAEAVESILEPLGGEFSVNGLSLLIEYFEPYEWTEKLENGQTKIFKGVNRRLMVLSPVLYELEAQTLSSSLTRGIFSVPTYKGNLRIKANFVIPDNPYLMYTPNGLLKNNAFVSISFADNKTLLEFPQFSASGKKLVRKDAKEDLSALYAGDVQLDVMNMIKRDSQFGFEGTVSFQGGNALRFAPLAGDSIFTVSSDWKTPSFSGGWLPTERSVSDEGFSAGWKIAGISTKIDPVNEYFSLVNTSQRNDNSYYRKNFDDSDKITVRFFTPVESYRKTERSIKYALLFLLVPFLTIFLFEIFIKIKIHPVQYCLIGLANIIFYLLLLSVSEHLSFNLSYVLSAAAVTALTSLYIGSILRNIKWAGLIALIQSISYVFLFGTLQAEDYALLIGSLGLFVVVAVLMLITRKIDWYGREN